MCCMCVCCMCVHMCRLRLYQIFAYTFQLQIVGYTVYSYSAKLCVQARSKYVSHIPAVYDTVNKWCVAWIEIIENMTSFDSDTLFHSCI